MKNGYNLENLNMDDTQYVVKKMLASYYGVTINEIECIYNEQFTEMLMEIKSIKKLFVVKYDGMSAPEISEFSKSKTIKN